MTVLDMLEQRRRRKVESTAPPVSKEKYDIRVTAEVHGLRKLVWTNCLLAVAVILMLAERLLG